MLFGFFCFAICEYIAPTKKVMKETICFISLTLEVCNYGKDSSGLFRGCVSF